jgi:hypothetical protein
VFLPSHSFCRELSNPAYTWLGGFVQNNDIVGNEIYTWLEIQYRTPQYPDIPQYHHKFAPLAPVVTYASWTEAEDRAARKILHDQWMNSGEDR